MLGRAVRSGAPGRAWLDGLGGQGSSGARPRSGVALRPEPIRSTMLGWLPVFSSAGWFRSAVRGGGYVSSRTVRGVRRAAGPLVIPSPRRGGMTRYANEVLAGVVNQNARPRRGAGVMTCTTSTGQEVGSGRSCGDPRAVEGTDVPVPHRVVHVGQLLPGGGGLADVAAAAVGDAMFQCVRRRCLGRGPGPTRSPPTAPAGSPAW